MVTSPLDLLLASRLANRVDPGAPRVRPAVAAVGAASPGAAAGHDPRLPSRHALEQLAPGKLRPAPGPAAAAGGTQAPAPGLLSAATQLSEGAQSLQAALVARERPPPVAGAVPLWSDGQDPIAAAPLAHVLQDVLEHSGVFYESHLRAFAQGRRPLASLWREPPGQPSAAGGAVQGPPLASHEAGTPPTADRPPGAQADGAPGDAHAASPVAANPDRVAQQLELLETGVFRWTGQAWPGVRLDWEVCLQAPEGDEAGVQAPPVACSTRLVLALPGLGVLDAMLHLDGGRLQLVLVAPDEAGAAQLRASRPRLLERLHGLGLQVLACRITHAAP